MAEFIGAVVEAFAGLMMALAEALPAIFEALVYVALGVIAIIAYAVSSKFRERKRQEWRERPKRKYVDIGISGACLATLLGLGAWILWTELRARLARESAAVGESQRGGEIQVVISKRSGQGSNELKIMLTREQVAKLFQKRSLRQADRKVSQSPGVDGAMDSTTNNVEQTVPRKRSTQEGTDAQNP